MRFRELILKCNFLLLVLLLPVLWKVSISTESNDTGTWLMERFTPACVLPNSYVAPFFFNYIFGIISWVSAILCSKTYYEWKDEQCFPETGPAWEQPQSYLKSWLFTKYSHVYTPHSDLLSPLNQQHHKISLKYSVSLLLSLVITWFVPRQGSCERI